jgi:pentatricopeptide repeat protein
MYMHYAHSACTRAGHYKEALGLFDMLQRRCSTTQKPAATTANNSSSTVKTAAAHTQQALPDVHTYAEALTACALDNRVDRALAILKEMPAAGVQPNAVCYSVAIKACDKAGRYNFNSLNISS